MGEMKINIKLETNPMEKWLYKLIHKYKYIVKKETKKHGVSQNYVSFGSIIMGYIYGHPT